MFCPNCGKQVNEPAKFCEKCGFDLGVTEPEKTQPPVSSHPIKCAYHPYRDSVGICAGCGKGICTLCRTVASGKLYCASCVSNILNNPSRSTASSWSEPLIPKKKRNISVIATAFIIIVVCGVLAWIFIPSCALVINPTEGGAVTGDGTFHRFSHTQITAIPNEYYEFNGWIGKGISDPNSSSAVVSIGMSGETITASFKRFCIASAEGHQYWEYFDKQPPDFKLINNGNAINPTWAQLKAFILADNTDRLTYVDPSFMCGDFAERVHDNAEKAGIKAAFVLINFNGRFTGHALNAFSTSDRGLVYVDCTGGEQYLLYSRVPADGWDKIAYVEAGKEYGLISLDAANSVTYDFYDQYSKSYQTYAAAVKAYNKLYDQYTGIEGALINQYCVLGNATACNQLNSMYYELKRQETELNKQSTKWGDVWQSGGIVENISIYW